MFRFCVLVCLTLLLSAVVIFVFAGNISDFSKKKFSPEHFAFNEAVSVLKEGDMDNAERMFLDLISKGDAPENVRAGAFYNLGNIFWKKIMASGDVSFFKSALLCFVGALRSNPGLLPAKINLEFLLTLSDENATDGKEKDDSDALGSNQDERGLPASGSTDDYRKRTDPTKMQPFKIPFEKSNAI